MRPAEEGTQTQVAKTCGRGRTGQDDREESLGTSNTPGAAEPSSFVAPLKDAKTSTVIRAAHPAFLFLAIQSAKACTNVPKKSRVASLTSPPRESKSLSAPPM